MVWQDRSPSSPLPDLNKNLKSKINLRLYRNIFPEEEVLGQMVWHERSPPSPLFYLDWNFKSKIKFRLQRNLFPEEEVLGQMVWHERSPSPPSSLNLAGNLSFHIYT